METRANLAQPMAYSDSCRLLRELQIFKTIADPLKKLQTIANCEDNHTLLQTIEEMFVLVSSFR